MIRFIIALFMLVAAPVAAQNAPSADTDARIIRLSRGQRAPSDGLLAPEFLFVDWRSRLAVFEGRLRIETEAATARAATALELCNGRIELADERLELVDSLWRDRAGELAESLTSSLHEDVFDSPIFWYVMGVATVVILAIAAGVVGFAAAP